MELSDFDEPFDKLMVPSKVEGLMSSRGQPIGLELRAERLSAVSQVFVFNAFS